MTHFAVCQKEPSPLTHPDTLLFRQGLDLGAEQSHVGHLMARGGKVETFTGKPEIAKGIAAAVAAAWK